MSPCTNRKSRLWASVGVVTTMHSLTVLMFPRLSITDYSSDQIEPARNIPSYWVAENPRIQKPFHDESSSQSLKCNTPNSAVALTLVRLFRF